MKRIKDRIRRWRDRRRFPAMAYHEPLQTFWWLDRAPLTDAGWTTVYDDGHHAIYDPNMIGHDVIIIDVLPGTNWAQRVQIDGPPLDTLRAYLNGDTR